MEKIQNITQNDIKIMSFMYDRKTGRGLSKSKAMTIDEISANIDFVSESKIRTTIRLLLQLGFIDYGIKNGKKNTYHIKPEGLSYIESIKKVVINLNEEE